MRILSICIMTAWLAASAATQEPSQLRNLAQVPDYESRRVSSSDRSGGNDDFIRIEPGETVTLAEIDGPGAITHIWNTLEAERYAPRLLILRMYWDGQNHPAVQVPLGDFFGVGHGLNRSFSSLPVSTSSSGRARHSYWHMPFAQSARITLTHEGFRPIHAFYYAIDYQTFNSPPQEPLYFHAHYRQATPNPDIQLGGQNLDGRSNYLLMETQGRGQYVGTVLSVQTNADEWFGEGDDMFFIDGDPVPTLAGTGTEDYFGHAWGFRQFHRPFHGVTLWEGTHPGSRVTAYRWHIADPIAFQQSLRATIEHGHANNRQDDFYSVAFWYQTLPSPQPPALANVLARLPDEGQLYAQRIFLNKTINTNRRQGQFNAALQAVNEFASEHDNADQFGFTSLWRGLLLKRVGYEDPPEGSFLPWVNQRAEQFEEVQAAFHTALEQSQSPGKRREGDAEAIGWLAERELAALQDSNQARLYVSGQSQFKVYVDNEVVAEGRARYDFEDYPIKLSDGEHTIAVECRPFGEPFGFAARISHKWGTIFTDNTWKVSTQLEEGWYRKNFNDAQWANAASIGQLGEDTWESLRDDRYYFLAPILTAPVIAPEPPSPDSTVYFRKQVRLP